MDEFFRLALESSATCAVLLPDRTGSTGDPDKSKSSGTAYEGLSLAPTTPSVRTSVVPRVVEADRVVDRVASTQGPVPMRWPKLAGL